MPFVDVYGARKAAQVMQDTWGHLAPDKGTRYPGYMVIAASCFGDGSVAIVAWEFGALASSPWTYEETQEFAVDAVEKMRNRRKDKNRAGVFRFDGYYREFKKGGGRFYGKVRRVRVPGT